MTALVDSIRYNALPSLEEANITRQVPFVDNVINTPVRDVFHQHAATWMTSGGNVLPMEFAVAAASITTPVPTPSFILDLLSVLASNICEGLFGIDTITKSDLVEMTIGDASDNGTYDEDKFIPVAFAFNEVQTKSRVHQKANDKLS